MALAFKRLPGTREAHTLDMAAWSTAISQGAMVCAGSDLQSKENCHLALKLLPAQGFQALEALGTTLDLQDCTMNARGVERDTPESHRTHLLCSSRSMQRLIYSRLLLCQRLMMLAFTLHE